MSEPCVVFQCRAPGNHDLMWGTSFLGSVCTNHGERLGHGEIERRRLTLNRDEKPLYDVYVIDERAAGFTIVASIKPNAGPADWTIYAPEHYVIIARGARDAGPIHEARFNEDTGAIEVLP